MKRPDIIQVGQKWYKGSDPFMVPKKLFFKVTEVDKDYVRMVDGFGNVERRTWAFLKHAEGYTYMGMDKEDSVITLLKAVDEL